MGRVRKCRADQGGTYGLGGRRDAAPRSLVSFCQSFVLFRNEGLIYFLSFLSSEGISFPSAAHPSCLPRPWLTGPGARGPGRRAARPSAPPVLGCHARFRPPGTVFLTFHGYSLPGSLFSFNLLLLFHGFFFPCSLFSLFFPQSPRGMMFLIFQGFSLPGFLDFLFFFQSFGLIFLTFTVSLWLVLYFFFLSVQVLCS